MSGLKNFLHNRLWTIFTCLFIIVGLMFLWIVTPSTLLFRPVEWKYEPTTGTVAFTRVVNSDRDVIVRWSHIIYVHDGSCAAGGIRPFDARTNLDMFPVQESLRRCLDDPANVAILTWSPLWLGRIPLRPFTMTVPAGAEIPRHVAPVR